MSSFDHINGAAAALALVCAFGVPERQRRAAVVLATVFLLSWAHYVQSYSPRPVVALLWDMDIILTSHDVWSLLDATIAMGGLVAFATKRAWWGAAIFALATTQVALHGLYWDVRLLPRATYYPALDTLFLAQVAVFILAGGGGIVARIGRVLGRRRHVRRPRASAYLKAR